jgi:hypothetical protein
VILTEQLKEIPTMKKVVLILLLVILIAGFFNSALLSLIPMIAIPAFFLWLIFGKKGSRRGASYPRNDALENERQRYGDNPGDPFNTSNRVE